MRIGRVKVEDLYATIDWCLRKDFPLDFDSRCLYTACAIHSVLKNEGIPSIIVGGDAVAFTVSVDGSQASVEGFASAKQGEPSHYWVETSDLLLDPNVSYLPERSRIKRVPMPMVAWERKQPLPQSLQYREQIRHDENVEFRFTEDIAARMDSFVNICIKRFKSKVGKKRLSGFIISSPESIKQHASNGNKWALSALRFQKMQSVPTI
ncbi:hypothetical protein [uncultured Alteromonas sp.]|jgi:hypothetical protein|uniref:hypothetical protein n=1 Tax=uncultured Alteromonas sp. TaxID=179113 RepID=UPI0030CAD708|tara:strand:+ start:1761 stop:2384 length:624 start_codon:yes stop_codon:yes gene_type:complete